jgi:CPA2 family monovalent cation:H+ antiporter-2
MIDPAQMLMHWPAVLGLTLVVIVVKSINCTLGSLLTGLDLKNAIQTGVGLAQIGEFAYLVALIGVSMKTVDSSLYQIAVGVSVLTTLLNPFLLRASDPFADWVELRLPQRWKEYLETYANWTERFRHSSLTSESVKALRFNLFLVVVQLALVAVFFIAAAMVARLDFTSLSPRIEADKKMLLWGAACLLTVPNAIFLYFRSRALGREVAEALVPAKVAETLWALSFKRFTGSLFTVAGVAALFFEITLLSGTIMPEQGWARALVGVTLLVVGVFGWKGFRRMGVESLETLRSVLTKEVETDPTDSTAELLDIHTERLTLRHADRVQGRSLREIDLRAQTGASVIGIERNGKTTVNPMADERLAVGDVVLLLGDDEQIAQARALLG